MTVAGARPARADAALLAWGIALPAVAGAAAVLGFAPFHAWPVPIAALAVLFLAWSRSGSALQAAVSGFSFGLGLNLAGVSWVFVSLHQFGHMPAVLAAIATFLFCAYLALFPAAAGWISHRFAGGGPRRLLAAMPAAFVLLEWVRGWLFTGFPWLAVGYSQAPASPLAGFAPVLGAYGVSLAVAVAAAFLAAFASSPAWSRRRAALAIGFVALLLAGAALRFVAWTAPSGEPVAVALLQGNVPQHLKWRDEVRARTLRDYHAQAVRSPARVVVLPETALPAFLDQLPPGYLESLRGHARAAGKEILIGSVERGRAGEGYAYWNSVVRIGAGEDRSYRKRHLVPFGEFIPPGFGWVLAVLNIPLTDFARGEADQPPLAAGGTTWAVAICYEDIFGEELAATLPQAGALLNVSNDAWFGESLAADQHLQFSQMRALETGRWMVRATNTGVTAAIDEKGRVVARLAQFTRGELAAQVVPHAGATPFVRWGNLGALAVLAGLAAAGLGRRGDGGLAKPVK
ncbi:MAG: apolipoprotein N-acyltransferase [Betaproteobacteria bacterium]|nr:MAG: apolipoprotein N-acyltransferase [Betaproteobacteria bacterium]